jgi:hypothetical protein
MALEWACFHRGPTLKTMGGRCFPDAFKRMVRFNFYQGTFIEEFQRYVKEGSGNRHLSP